MRALLLVTNRWSKPKRGPRAPSSLVVPADLKMAANSITTYPEATTMFKLNENANVYPQLMEHSRKEIEATNTFVSNLKGTCVAIHTIRHGQPRPYADHAYEALIVCIQPNSKTTNAPLPRVIDIDAAKTLARLFVHPFIEKTSDEKWASPQLQFIRPEPNPCGLDDGEYHKKNGMSSCWHVLITSAYTG